MNIILKHPVIINHTTETSFLSWIEPIMSVITVILGVITIIIANKVIKSKRANAKYGFYINFLSYIERFKAFLDEYPGITAHLVSKDLREEHIMQTTTDEVAEKVIPIFTSLCNEFLGFISTANDNVVPKHCKNSNLSAEEEWFKWYDNIKFLITYTQKCKLLDQNLTPYFTLKQIQQYYDENKKFIESLDYLSSILNNAVMYPSRKSEKRKSKA